MANTVLRQHGGTWRVVVAAALMLMPVAASAQLDEAAVSEQIVAVRVYKDDRLVAEGSGVVINDQGDVLTSAAVLDAGPRATVVTMDSMERITERRWKGEIWDLAVLRTEGLPGPGLPLSVAEVVRGATVFAVTPDVGSGTAVFTRGAVGELATSSIAGNRVRYVQHNSELTVRGYGSPVVNECGEIVGLNVPNPNEISIFNVPRKIEPKEAVYAFSVGEIITRLRTQGIDFVNVADACKTAAERAEEERKKAEIEAAEDKRRAEEAEILATDAEAIAVEAAKKAEQEKKARAAAERKRQEALEMAEAEKRQKEEADRLAALERERSEKLRRIAQWGGAVAAALLLLLVLFWGLSAQRKRRALRSAQARAESAEQEARRARRRVADLPEPAPFDCVLTGEDESGTPYALNLRRDALGLPAGVVVGRDPAKSSHVVAEPSVSRAHVRMYVSRGDLHVEDVGSTNGTYLNGNRLAVGEGAHVTDGDELVLGSITLRVELRH